MKISSIQLQFCCRLSVIALCLLAPRLHAQTSPAQAGAASAHAPQRLRSRLFIYDLRDGSSHLVYTADTVWEAPNWSPDGKYLISNSNGAIYKFVLKQDGTAEPQKTSHPRRLSLQQRQGHLARRQEARLLSHRSSWQIIAGLSRRRRRQQRQADGLGLAQLLPRLVAG